MTHTYYAIHPDDFKNYDTEKIRQSFLINDLFKPDEITLHYTHYDRLIVGGISPTSRSLALEPADELKARYFLERREIGIINVGAPCSVSVDNVVYALDYKEAIYIGMQVRNVVFHPAKDGVARLYFNSAPAHAVYPTRKISVAEAETVTLGSQETSNHRTIRKLLVNSVLPTCQLQMGLTELKSGSVWNTMPPHVHSRRMEAYFYFEIPEKQMVCHFLGEPDETRHVWVNNHEVVLSPPWSVHCGAGTSSYSFIWGMAGENLDYGDMDAVAPENLR
jgi:4-deoxy-L-threo-5-hexosulose-uronate ketol-isomerase